MKVIIPDEELEQIDRLITQIKAHIKEAPEGKLYCAMNKGRYPQFYKVTETVPYEKRYIRKDEGDIIDPLAQKEYDKKILKVLEEQRSHLSDFLDIYDPEKAALDVYMQMPEPNVVR